MSLGTRARFDVVRLSPNVTAEVRGIDLRVSLSPSF
jgi:hypothetical protein